MTPEASPQTPGEETRGVIARLEFAEAPQPFFGSVSNLFTDLGLAHDLGVLLAHPDYDGYRFGNRFWWRNARPLQPAHRLRAFKIAQGSPLFLELLCTAIGGVWTLIQIVDKVANWKLDRQKAELQFAKMRQDLALGEMEILQKRLELERVLQERHAQQIADTLIRRLRESEFELQDLDLRRWPPR